MAVASRQHDLEAVRVGLARWLRARRPFAGDLRVAPLTRPSSGLSSETLFVEVAWTVRGDERRESLVARLPPAGDGLFPDYDLAAQAEVQRRLESTGVPVAPQLAHETDPRWVGAPFLLMGRVPGRVLLTNPSFVREGWLHDAPPEDQARLHRGFLEVLARIHRLDWDQLGLGFLARGASAGVGAALDGWGDYLAWASDGAPLPQLTDGLAWCRAHRPDPEPPPSLLWGDVQFANAVFDDDLRPAAILDWELAALGPAETDLGWHLALHRMTVDTAGGDLPGFPGREAALAAYESALGRPLVDVPWFEVFALVRSGAIMARIARLLLASGIDDTWLTKGNPQLDLLARLTTTDAG